MFIFHFLFMLDSVGMRVLGGNRFCLSFLDGVMPDGFVDILRNRYL